MNNNLNYLPKILFIGILGYIVAKFLYMMFISWSTAKNKTGTLDQLDQMIEAKKLAIKTIQGTSTSTKSHPSTAAATHIVPEIQKYIEKMKWGDSPELIQLKAVFEDRYKIDIDKSEIQKTIQIIIQAKSTFEKLSQLTQLKELILLTCYLNELINEVNDQQYDTSPLLKDLSIQLSCKEIHLAKAATYLYYQKFQKGQNSSGLFSQILGPNKKLTPFNEQNLHQLSVLTFDDLKTRLKELATIFYAITPLPDFQSAVDTKKEVLAYQIIDLTEWNEQKLSTQFKKLAQIYHPDKYSNAGLTSLHLATIRTNFIILKDAYEYLKGIHQK